MHPSGTAMAAKTGSRFCLSATKVIIFAHLLTIAVTTLILVWLLNFREGFAFEKIFNLHSFLMAVGFVLVAGEAIMTYKTVPAQRETQEIFHLILHCVALVAGSIGIYAVLKFHYELSILDMNTLHSWIGMSTFCLFGLQFLLCLFSFMFPSANSGVRSRMETWHMFIGIVIFLMAITSAETGLVERFTALGLSNDQPNLIMNFTGLLILLPGVGVALRTRSRMVQVLIGIVISLLAMTSAETVKFTPLTLQRRQEAVIINFIGISILLFGVGVCVVVILRRPS